MTRSLLVFTLDIIVSWASGEVVDWIQDKINGPQLTALKVGDFHSFYRLMNPAIRK